MANTLDGLVWRKPLCMKERSVSAQPSDSDLDSFRDEKRVVDVASQLSSGTSNFYVAGQSSALTIANGSRLSDIASKFLKFCWVPLQGVVTWGKI
jgi:hypothetical protein